METLTIDVSESLKRSIQQRVTEDGYGGVGDYVRELIVSDLRRKAAERLDALLIEGLESGEPIEVTPEFWEERKRRLIERFGPPPESS